LRFWEIKPALLDGICRELASLLGLGAAAAGARRLLVRDGDQAPRPIEPREVGGALRAARIPFAYYRQEKVFDTVEAREVLDVLGALAEPDDRTARYRAFITPFFGLTLPDLAACDD